MSSVLEIVELLDGEVVLRSVDGEDEPMVSIRFSEEANAYMPYIKLEVAKAMIQAGIQAFAELTEQADEATFEGVELASDQVVH